MQHSRRPLALALMAASALAATAPAAQAHPTVVCNQAGVGHSGGPYDTDGSDPNPPARFTQDREQLGHGVGTGLPHAADRSPALARCEEGEGGGGGGEDPGPTVT